MMMPMGGPGIPVGCMGIQQKVDMAMNHAHRTGCGFATSMQQLGFVEPLNLKTYQIDTTPYPWVGKEKMWAENDPPFLGGKMLDTRDSSTLALDLLGENKARREKQASLLGLPPDCL